MDARVATIIFMASRIVDQHKPIKKILSFTECTEKELSKCYKKVKTLFPQYQTRLMASTVVANVCGADPFNLPADII